MADNLSELTSFIKQNNATMESSMDQQRKEQRQSLSMLADRGEETQGDRKIVDSLEKIYSAISRQTSVQEKALQEQRLARATTPHDIDTATRDKELSLLEQIADSLGGGFGGGSGGGGFGGLLKSLGIIKLFDALKGMFGKLLTSVGAILPELGEMALVLGKATLKWGAFLAIMEEVGVGFRKMVGLPSMDQDSFNMNRDLRRIKPGYEEPPAAPGGEPPYAPSTRPARPSGRPGRGRTGRPETEEPGGEGPTYTLPKGEKGGGVIGGLIQTGESGSRDPYNIANRPVGGGKYVPERGYKLTDMTVGEVMRLQEQGKIFAAGKYQIVGRPGKKRDTMEETVRAMNIDPNEKFSPEMQEKLFRGYLIAGKRPAIKSYITGKSKERGEAILSGAQEFSSVGIPYDVKGRRKGQSYYPGDRASISPEKFGAALDEERKRYQEYIKQGMDPEEAWMRLSNLSKSGKLIKPKEPESVPSTTRVAQPETTPEKITGAAEPIALNQLKAGDVKNLNLPENVSLSKKFLSQGGFKGIDPVLIEGILGAAKNWKGKVEIFSGNRTPGKNENENHSIGKALDVKLIDENGREILPIKNAKTNQYGDYQIRKRKI